MKRTKVGIQTNTELDYTTGEIKKDGVMVSAQFESEPAYIKFYTGDILFLKGTPTGLNTILLSLLRRMSYENDIFINSSLKRIIANETGKKFDTVNKAITQFVKGDILIRKDSGHYVFNPYIFGRGKWQDVKAIRLTIEYNLKGRTFTSIIKTSEEESGITSSEEE